MPTSKSLKLFAFVVFSVIFLFGIKEHTSSWYTLEDQVETGTNINIIKNDGQWESTTQYRLKMKMGQVDFRNNSVLFVMAHPDDLREAQDHGHSHEEDESDDLHTVRMHGMEWEFVGANLDASIFPISKKLTKYNYFLGMDKSTWASNVPAYEQVKYQNIYPGIDLHFYESKGHLKYDFIVRPGADPSLIKMKLNHIEEASIVNSELHIKTSVNELVKAVPYTYQEDKDQRKDVSCTYVLDGNILSFATKSYDADKTLIIDPELLFASYSGATSDNWGNSATFDSDEALYAGSTAFGNFPTQTGAFELNFSGGETDCAISKFTPDGSLMEYSTYLGGRGSELPTSIIVNSKGELVILSITSSNDFPMLASSYDSNFKGGANTSENGIDFPQGTDMAVTVLSATGDAIVGSTYFGGSRLDGLARNVSSVDNYGDEFRGEVIVDNNDQVYVVSTTTSNDIPLKNAADGSLNEGGSTTPSDAMVFSLNEDLSDLRFSTYLGGEGVDVGTSIKLDSNNDILVCGSTASSRFPTRSGAYQGSIAGGTDAYVSKISGNDFSILQSTYLGKSGNDLGYLMDIGTDNNIYIVGINGNSNWDITNGKYGNPGSANFIQVLDPNLSTGQFSTLVGNGNGTSGALVVTAFLVDNCNRVYISGWGGRTNNFTSSVSGMPTTTDGFQRSTDGSDFYLMILNSDVTDIEYGTYFGGSQSAEHVDGGTSRFSKEGLVYQAVCAGCGGNDDFPVSPGVVSQLNNSSNCNLGVFKFSLGLSNVKLEVEASGDSGCAPFEVTFNNTTEGSDIRYEWSFGNGNTSSEKNPTQTFQAGSYTIQVIGISEESCSIPDTLEIQIEVEESMDGGETFEVDFCEGESITLESSSTNSQSYLWNNGNTNSSLTITQEGIYWVDNMGEECVSRDSFIVTARNSNISNTSFEGCDSVEVAGTIYTESGTFETSYTNQFGCDSTVILDVLINPTTTSFSSIDGCDSVTYGVFVITESGRFQFKSVNQFGCDSIDIVDVIIYPSSIENVSLEGCDSVEYGGVTYTQSGTFENTFVNIFGCDSTEILDILINPFTSSMVSLESCDSVEYGGTVYKQSGIFTNTFSNALGCDSIETVNVVVNTGSIATVSFDLCPKEEIEIGSIVYNSSGQYTQDLMTIAGCDSTLNIIINQSLELAVVDFEQCDASIEKKDNETYEEFTADTLNLLDCGSFSLSTVYRRNPSVNIHSCTEGVDSTIAMCITSLDDCNYDAGNEKSVVFEITLAPEDGSQITFDYLSFYERSPELFDWIDGANGINNYPTRYGIRVLKDNQVIFEESEVFTSVDWNLESYCFDGITAFTVDAPTTFVVEILPYCLAGFDSVVSAWDIDNLSFYARCANSQQISAAGRIYDTHLNLMSDVAVNCISDQIENTIDISDENGIYAFESLPNVGSYTIYPEKNNDVRNGISTKDLLVLQRHILGLQAFEDAYQFIAGDINKNKRVSGADLVELRKVILEKQDQFSNNNSWLFIDKSLPINMDTPYSYKETQSMSAHTIAKNDLDFVGIKVGDLDRSYELSGRSKGMNLLLDHPSESQGLIKHNSIDVIATEDMDLYGLQLALGELTGGDWSIVSGVLDMKEHHYSTANGLQIAADFAVGVSVEDGDVLFTLHGAKNAADIQNLLDYDTSPELYLGSDLSTRALTFSNASALTYGFDLLQNRPNPFTTTTQVSFSIDRSAHVDLTIMDLNGRIVQDLSDDFDEGTHHLNLDWDQADMSGVYLCKMQFEGKVKVVKMVRY